MMHERKLSRRLQAVAELATPGLRVADVGCDHAYVSIYLAERGIAAECLAIDVNEGPLLRAQENILAHGLTERIHTRLGSGLERVSPGEVDAVLMAGMGGILIRDLLENSREVSQGLKEWILQPQSDLDLVRRYIRESGFCIVEENMVQEDGKYYPMFRAVPAAEAGVSDTGTPVSAEPGITAPDERQQAVFDRFGKLLLTGRSPVLQEYLEQGQRHYTAILQQMKAAEGECPAGKEPDIHTEASSRRRQEQMERICEEAEYIRQALEFYS